MPAPDKFWSLSADELLANLSSTREGLSQQEARRRLKAVGPNLLKPQRKTGTIFLLLSQFKSPIILILLFASGLSFYLGDTTNAAIIIGIVLINGLLSFWQERGALNAVQKLLAMVRIKEITYNGYKKRPVKNPL
jgi:Mg2+-importing ATPase